MMPTVDELAAAGIAELQQIVDAGEAQSADLRAQRDALNAQIRDLSVQVTALNNQITQIEGTEAATARISIANLNALRQDPRRPVLPRVAANVVATNTKV